jgi:Helix-turn-helix domain
MLFTIKDLSAQLNIKPSTLSLWAAQGKIPCRKIHGLIRFDPDAIAAWLRSFEPSNWLSGQYPAPPHFAVPSPTRPAVYEFPHAQPQTT